MAPSTKKAAPKPAAKPAAPVAAAKPAATADYWKWIYLVAVITAGVYGAMNQLTAQSPLPADALWIVLVTISLVSGFFYFQPGEFTAIALRFLVFEFAARYAAGFAMAGVSGYLIGWFTAWANYLGILAVGLALRLFYNRFFTRQ